MQVIAVLIATLLGATLVRGAEPSAAIENKAVIWRWNVSGGKLHPERIEDRLNGGWLPLSGECFRVVLADGTVLKSSDFKLTGALAIEALKPEPASPVTARHETGQQLVATF